MSKREVLSSEHAPKAIGPYSQGIRCGQMVFFSGQIPLDANGEFVGQGDVRAQAEQVMKNIEALLKSAGLGFDDVVKATMFLVDLADFATVNEIYAKRFEGIAPPARSTIQVAALPRGAKVEVEIIAIAG
ncbi:RidA family protein [Sandaracinus amylolyticus]|uniref:RidA family protein n=1 Tax=Sandaracinus amylolyticus TaxID=927083 RepID=UPI001F16D8ED|nr:RidA family protein [Sandaracinus amylolyticus]UJR81293.1 Translation initiation inhibitor [Sandaracinus amylolyticus]